MERPPWSILGILGANVLKFYFLNLEETFTNLGFNSNSTFQFEQSGTFSLGISDSLLFQVR